MTDSERLKSEILLNSEDARKYRIAVEGECWRWNARDFVFFGFRPVDLLYANAIGPVGKGIVLRPCQLNEWCVNPWHWQAYNAGRKTHCQWGHELNAKGVCRKCRTEAQKKWRARKRKGLTKQTSSVTS